jgi:hypothetical protein
MCQPLFLVSKWRPLTTQKLVDVLNLQGVPTAYNLGCLVCWACSLQVVAKKTKKPKKKDVKKVLDRTAKRIARADAHVAHVIAATENISKKKVAEAEFADSVAATAVQVDALTGPLILPAVAAGAAVVSAKAKADDVINYNSISAKKIAKAIKKAEKAKAKAKRKAAKQIAAIQEYYAEQISYAKVAYLPFTGKAVKSGGKKAAPGIFLPPVLASAPTLGPQAIPYLLKGVHDGAGPAPVLRVLSNFDEDAINDLNGLFIGDGAGLLPPSAAEHLVLPVDLPDFDLVKAVGQLKACAKAALEGLVEGTAQPGKGGLPAPLPAGLVRTLVDLNPGI